MIHAFEHSLLDVLKNIPILLVVYSILYWLEHTMRAAPALLERAQSVGPIIGAIAGLFPQCGFSAAASALFVEGFLAPATLVSVFLATSDEALPLMLSGGKAHEAVLLLVIKFVLAVIGGYLLQLTVFRRNSRINQKPVQIDVHHDCACHAHSAVGIVITRTLHTCLFLLVVVFVMNLSVHLIGTERLSSLLLGGSVLQPVLCAFIGLIPSCAISVLLTELYLSGAIGLGGLIAGLSTGAGFGYMILLRDHSSRKKAIPVIAATLVLAIIGGIVIQALLG